MKIVIIGSNYSWSIERSYSKELRKLGLKVVLLPAQNWFYFYYYKNVVNKIFFQLGVSSIYRIINEKLLKKVNLINPDFILVFKGMEILPRSLEIWRNKKIKLINYNPDNPFIFSGKGSGNKNVLDSIEFFHLHLTYDHQVLRKLKLRGLNCVFFPFCLEVNEDLFSVENKPIDKLAFVGNPDKHRVNFINDLAALDVPMIVFGNNWSNFHLDPRVEIDGQVDKVKYKQIAKSYRALLNIMRIHNPDSHNMRTIEIPGYGGIQLATRTRDHKSFFEEDKTIFLFDNAAEAKMKWQYILGLTEGELLLIRSSAFQTVKNMYSYEKRVSELYNIMIHWNAN